MKGDCPSEDRILREAVLLTLRRHGIGNAQITLNVVDDHRIAELHQRFLSRGEPTDVLTFDLSESQGLLEGQIVISEDTARREAGRRGHSVIAELSLYAVHGTLHLLGYNDTASDDAQRMHVLEDELLEQLGFGAVYSGSFAKD